MPALPPKGPKRQVAITQLVGFILLPAVVIVLFLAYVLFKESMK